MNIRQITDNLLCSGCGTCNTICGHNAISMKRTHTMGLLHADIDTTKCTDCGLCLKMCPSVQVLENKEKVAREQIIGDIKACYVGRALDKVIFANAQSGGMVTTVLTYLFSNKLIDAAVSCRMEYGWPVPSIHYSILTNTDGLKRNQKSCYTQVDIVSALKETSQFKSVAVVGVPCHIQGVSNLMSLKQYSNITYRIGLVCDKTYSDLYMDAIMFGIRSPQGEVNISYKRKDFTYKAKYYSYQQAPTVIANKEGEMVIIPNSKRMFLKDYFTVPKCKICWDKLNTQADIVLGDPWGLKDKYDEMKGDSVVIVRSEKAIQLIEDMHSANHIKLLPVSIEEVAKGQLVDQRVSDIRKCDWEKKIVTWNKNESLTREKYISQVIKRYRFVSMKSKVYSILSHIKHLK